MGKVKEAAEDWLEDCGYKLGYDWDSLPNRIYWKKIKTKRIYRRMYGRYKGGKNT